jgi:amino acid transporter
MVVCITILEGLLGFIYIGNTTAFNAILSMAILGMYESYLLPIVYMLLYGRKQGRVFGPFRLGRIGGVLTNHRYLLAGICNDFQYLPQFRACERAEHELQHRSLGWMAVLWRFVLFFVGKKTIFWTS